MIAPTSKNPSSSATKNPDAANPAESPKAPADAKPAEPAKAKAQAARAPSDGVKSDTKTIVSITVDGKLARQARLLSKIRGVTISSLFVEAAARTIPVALKAALASIKDEVE